MKRYFTVKEEVVIQYEHRTSYAQDKEIEEKFDGDYQKWLKSKKTTDVWNGINPPEHNQIIDYMNIDWNTVDSN